MSADKAPVTRSERQPWGRQRDWPRLWLPSLLFGGAACAGLTPVADGDIYWHLAAGREIAQRHALLYSDPFSVSGAGRAWTDVHWLFQLAVYALHGLGGLWALLIVKCLSIGVGALLLYAAVGRRAQALFVLSCLASLFAARHLLLMRPVIVSLVLLACFFLQLERFRRSGRSTLLVGLPLLQVLWSNCQGLSALGPALVFAYAVAALCSLRFAEQRWFAFAPEAAPGLSARVHMRALVTLLLACCAASLITPYGMASVTLPAELLSRLLPSTGNPYAQVAENAPPFALGTGLAVQFWHVPWFFGALVIAYALSRRVLLSHLLLVIGFGVLALLSNRNVLLFYWVATPIAALQLSTALRFARLRLWHWHPAHTAHAAHAAGAAYAAQIPRLLSRVVLAGLLVLMVTAAAHEPPFGQPVPFRFPTASVPRLAQVSERLGHLEHARIFCADQQGGYLIWTLYPRFHPYLDTRLGLRTPAQFSEYLALADEPERFGRFAATQEISYVILPVAYPDRYLGLIAHLYHNPDWRLIFTDGAEVLFARRELAPSAWDLSDTQTTERVLTDIRQRYGAAPDLHDAALIQFGMLDLALGEVTQAEHALLGSTSPAALALRARALLAAGDLDGAQELGEQRARASHDDVRNLVLMATVYVRRGRLQQSLHYLRRALAIDPFDGEALGVLAAIEEPQHVQ